MMTRIPSRSELAGRLRQYRYDAGMTAEEAAAYIGKKAGTLYKYESGTLSISERDLVSLLTIYDVDLDTAFAGPVSTEKSRRKNGAAKMQRELGAIYADLPDAAKAKLLEVARWLKAYCDDAQDEGAH